MFGVNKAQRRLQYTLLDKNYKLVTSSGGRWPRWRNEGGRGFVTRVMCLQWTEAAGVLGWCGVQADEALTNGGVGGWQATLPTLLRCVVPSSTPPYQHSTPSILTRWLPFPIINQDLAARFRSTLLVFEHMFGLEVRKCLYIGYLIYNLKAAWCAIRGVTGAVTTCHNRQLVIVRQRKDLVRLDRLLRKGHVPDTPCHALSQPLIVCWSVSAPSF